MTTPSNPEVTNEDRRLARDWAEQVEAHPDTWTERLRTAARVILADIPAPTPPTTAKENPDMPEPSIPDHAAARNYAARVLADPDYHSAEELAAARVLLAVLPKHPTLADMTAEERRASRRMQCDYKGITRNTTSRGVIGYFDHEERKAVILTDTNGIVRRDYDRVTPLPDLPRLEWPGDQKPAPAPTLPEGWRLADHPDYGRVVVTSGTVDADGHVYFVAPAPGTIGNDWHLCRKDELTYLDTNHPAPPNTITLGSTWDNTDALADACEESGRDQITVIDANNYAFIWAYDAEWWEGSAQPIDAPFTIIHTGFDGTLQQQQ